jgi:hypothetical protein
MFKVGTILLFVTACLSAAEIQLDVYGRSYVNSCGYYSNESADLQVNFGSHMFPWGTRIFVVTGWKGYDQTGGGGNSYQNWFNWAYRTEQEAKAAAPYQWRAELHNTLHDRSSNRFLTALQFAIRVEVPGMAPVNYPQISWAYYEAPIGAYGNSPCVSGNNLPPFRLIQQTIVERN